MYKIKFKPRIFDAIQKHFFLSCEDAVYYQKRKLPKDKNEFKAKVLANFTYRMKSIEQRVYQYENKSFKYTLNSFLNDLNDGKQRMEFIEIRLMENA